MSALDLAIAATYVVQVAGIALGVGVAIAWLSGRFAE